MIWLKRLQSYRGLMVFIMVKQYLDWLQDTYDYNFDVCILSEELKSKWYKYSKKRNDYEFLNKVNNRQILPFEIVLDLEEKERIDIILESLEKLGYGYKAWFTGSRGYHIHLIFPELKDEKKNVREAIKEHFINIYDCDIMKKTDGCMIAIETCPHWKTGQPKTLYKEFGQWDNNKLNLIKESLKYTKNEEKNQDKKYGKEDDKIRGSSFFINDILYEQVYDIKTNKVRFAFKEKGIVKYTDAFFFQGLEHHPLNGEELQKQVILLPDMVEPYTNITDLIKELKDFIHEYVDVPEQYETFSAWYVLLSWVYNKLNTINYMRVMGDTGLGKTRYMDTVGNICYKPMRIAGAVGAPPIFRLIQKWKGTLLLDESDFGDKDEAADIIKILNCGFQKGMAVIRCDKQDPDTLKFFDCFCPKIISSRKPFSDIALESRCLTHKVYSTKRDLPDSLGESFFKKQYMLRRKLLMFRFDFYNKINIENSLKIDLGDVEPRLRQATRSFASMFASDEVMLEDFKKFLLLYNNQMIEERSNTYDGQIINIIIKMMLEEEYNIITPSEISVKMQELGFKTNVISLSKHLKGLGIVTKQTRTVDKGNCKIIVFDENFINVVKRYVSDVSSVSDVSERIKIKNKVEEKNENKNPFSPYTTETSETPKQKYTNSYTNIQKFDTKIQSWQPCCYPKGQDGICGKSPCNELEGLYYCEEHWVEANDQTNKEVL